MIGIRVLDAADRLGRFAVEVMAALGATVERGAVDDQALARADVVVAGGAARPWLRRAAAWPRLVWVVVTPFGYDGPRATWAGGELVAQAAGGVLWPNGHPETPPLPLPGEPVTRCAGLHAALGALLGLLARRRHGAGCVVDVSLQESAAALLEHVAGEWFDRGDLARRRGSMHWSGTCRVGRCRDGEVLLTHVGDWTALREWLRADGAARDLEAPRWDDVDERCRHAAHVFDVLDAWAATYTVDALVEGAQLRRLAFAPVWDVARFAAELPLPPTPACLALDAGAVAAPRLLDGARVVDLTWVVAGPLATRILADHGAEVIRVERPDAPPPRGSSDANLQRGKRRIALDLHSADGLAALCALLREADVVVDNFSRRVLPNLGLGDAALRVLNPRLVVAHLTGFPAEDRRADWVTYGPTLQAMSGLVDAMRDADGRPGGPGFALADTATAWAAALAIVNALWRGGGAHLAVSQRDVLALLLGPLLAAGAPTPPAGRIQRCADADGRERWCAMTPPPGAVVPDPAGDPAELVVERLQAAGIPAAVVATPADLAADPQLRGRGWWQRADGIVRDGIVPRLLPLDDVDARSGVDATPAGAPWPGRRGGAMSETLKVILCCTDFSPEAEHAARHAVRLARSANAKLILAHLVHVASGELLSHDPHGPTNLTLTEGRERALTQLQDLRHRLAGDYADVELVVKFGAPAESATALAREHQADVIVTAVTDRHVHHEVTELLHESVTKALLHQAPCPILVVPPHAK